MLSSADIRAARFTVTAFHEGYEIAEVDELLAATIGTLEQLEHGRTTFADGRPLLTPQNLLDARFTPTLNRSGYDVVEIDDLLDEIIATLTEYIARAQRGEPLNQPQDPAQIQLAERAAADAAAAPRAADDEPDLSFAPSPAGGTPVVDAAPAEDVPAGEDVTAGEVPAAEDPVDGWPADDAPTDDARAAGADTAWAAPQDAPALDGVDVAELGPDVGSELPDAPETSVHVVVTEGAEPAVGDGSAPAAADDDPAPATSDDAPAPAPSDDVPAPAAPLPWEIDAVDRAEPLVPQWAPVLAAPEQDGTEATPAEDSTAPAADEPAADPAPETATETVAATPAEAGDAQDAQDAQDAPTLASEGADVDVQDAPAGAATDAREADVHGSADAVVPEADLVAGEPAPDTTGLAWAPVDVDVDADAQATEDFPSAAVENIEDAENIGEVEYVEEVEAPFQPVPAEPQAPAAPPADPFALSAQQIAALQAVSFEGDPWTPVRTAEPEPELAPEPPATTAAVAAAAAAAAAAAPGAFAPSVATPTPVAAEPVGALDCQTFLRQLTYARATSVGAAKEGLTFVAADGSVLHAMNVSKSPTGLVVELG